MKSSLLAGLVLAFSVAAEPMRIAVSEFELEYEISGKGEHTVLLEAGGGAGMTDWDPVFHRIAQHATVIRYSRVGNGNSTVIKRHFTSRDYADYASELLVKLNIKQPVILVAHSYGVTFPPILKHLKQKAARNNTTNQHELTPERASLLTSSLYECSHSRLFD